MTRRGNTTQRSIRIPDPLWTAAQTVAADRGDNLSDIIRGALVAYVAQWSPAQESPGTVKFQGILCVPGNSRRTPGPSF